MTEKQDGFDERAELMKKDLPFGDCDYCDLNEESWQNGFNAAKAQDQAVIEIQKAAITHLNEQYDALERRVEARDAKIAELEAELKSMTLNWHNCSALIMRIKRRKTIEDAVKLIESGKHLIWSSILRNDKALSRGEGGGDAAN